MREKLANALDSADVHSMGWKDRAIDAVLDAMREPDLTQLHDALTASRISEPPFLPRCKEIWAAEQVWTAMIDAAR